MHYRQKDLSLLPKNKYRHQKTMRKVIGIGETVLDIIFKGGKPIEAVPGGSSFNAVISLGRAGVNASFISEAGNDSLRCKPVRCARAGLGSAWRSFPVRPAYC